MRCLTALILVLLSFSIAACGDDDDDDGGGSAATTGQSSGVSKEDFIEQGDEICGEGNEEFAEINERLDAISVGSASEQLAEAGPILREGAELVDQRLAEFRALTPPPADEDTIDEYLDLVEDQRRYLEQMADAAAAGDVQEFQQTTERLQQAAEERQGIAQGYGFEVCGAE